MIARARKLGLLLPLLPKLGYANVGYVAWYRLTLRAGLHKRALPSGQAYAGPFFTFTAQHISVPMGWYDRLSRETDALREGKLPYFGHTEQALGNPPDWFKNPFDGRRVQSPETHWSELSDFALGTGDIKLIWEPSRFAWAPLLAKLCRFHGDPADLAWLNAWMSDWVEKNPVNRGPNWKCGQETAIRLMHVLLTAEILGSEATPALQRFVLEHAWRIERNIRYAIAQDNNHGTSEAAALVIAGAWLLRAGVEHLAVQRWFRIGRRWLEERLQHLVEEDGSFSQQSVTYHRVLLDTIAMVLLWQRRCGFEPFSHDFQRKAEAALDWLYAMVDPLTGDAPNLGPNDGAFLFALHGCRYRDFRPTIQWASVLLRGRAVYSAGPWDEQLQWFGIEGERSLSYPDGRTTRAFPQGGYVTIREGETWGLLRAPRGRFRPTQADGLHLDLWIGTDNILRDDGSYSYNSDSADDGDFGTSRAHNTVSFDGEDQMPKLSRFLYGAWLRTEEVLPLTTQDGLTRWSGRLVDHKGRSHTRHVAAAPDAWIITDTLAGPYRQAVLRWRLMPGDWKLQGNRLVGDRLTLAITSEGAPFTLRLVEGLESRHYLEKTPLPVLEIETGGRPVTLTTTLNRR